MNVSTGPNAAASGVDNSDEVEEFGQLPKRKILVDSGELKYLGRQVASYFLTGHQTVGYIEGRSGRKFLPQDSICELWGRHLDAVLNGDELRDCQDYALEGMSFVSGKMAQLDGQVRYLSYRSKKLKPVCDPGADACVRVPLSHAVILDFPICAIAVVHRFEGFEGRRFDLLESIDPSVYGQMADLGVLSNPALSKNKLGGDYSNLNSAAACRSFIGGISGNPVDSR